MNEQIWGRSVDFWTAIGTLGAVLAALGLPALGVALRYIRRPRLVAEFFNESACRRFTAIDTLMMDQKVKEHLEEGFVIVGMFFRLKVTNRGGRPAHNVQGRLTELLNRDGSPHEGVDPIALHWAGTPNDIDPGLTLLPGQTEFLDVFVISELRRHDRFIRPGRFAILGQMTRLRGTINSEIADRQVLKVSVLSSDADAASVEFRLPRQDEIQVTQLEHVKVEFRPLDFLGSLTDSWHRP